MSILYEGGRGQPPCNLSATHLRFTGIFPLPDYKQQYHLRSTVGLQGNFPPPNCKHLYKLWSTVEHSLQLWATYSVKFFAALCIIFVIFCPFCVINLPLILHQFVSKYGKGTIQLQACILQYRNKYKHFYEENVATHFYRIFTIK